MPRSLQDLIYDVMTGAHSRSKIMFSDEAIAAMKTATWSEGGEGTPGPTGPTGLTGPAGADGAPGAAGAAGATGSTGSTGSQGTQGIQGIQGETGAAGSSTWGSITGTLASQSDLNTALGLKATLAAPSFTGNVTISANNIITDTSTGMQIATGATQKIGFFGVTPVVRPTAFTQTYSTATATHAAVTQLAAPAGGTGATAGAYSTAANRDLMIASINAARTDIANVKQVLNQVIDQLQALGLLQ
jgi:hypothetical protein